MKDKYYDKYGIDSLEHLKIAADARCDFFITTNETLISDRKELEIVFQIKIRTPKEMNNL